MSEFKRQAEQMGVVTSWQSDTLSPEQREDFWRQVVEYESAPLTTHFQELIATGLELPEPEAMADEPLTAKLWEVIGALARIRVFIQQTDHLSDRELDSTLWHSVLRDEIPMLPVVPGTAWHIHLLSTGGEADTNLCLRYCADEDERQHWRADFPDYDMPAREDPPYDRDRYLPQPD